VPSRLPVGVGGVDCMVEPPCVWNDVMSIVAVRHVVLSMVHGDVGPLGTQTLTEAFYYLAEP